MKIVTEATATTDEIQKKEIFPNQKLWMELIYIQF